MNEKSYDASKLEHTKGQEGRVEDMTKAREMAEREKVYRTWADLYEEYLANPTAFNEKHKKGPPGSPNLFDVTPEVCEELAKMEVPVEYIRKLGELDAEAFGQILDYDQTLDGKSDTELLADQARFWGAKVLHELKRDFSRQNKPHEPGAFGFTAANVSESPEYYSELVKGWSADYRGTHAYYTRRLGRPYTSIIGKGVPRRRG